jgi:multiple sugar transport system permease protein
MDLKSTKSRILYTTFVLALFLIALAWLFPMVWMFSSALKSSSMIVRAPTELFPKTPLWRNYLRAWTELNYPQYFYNTLMLALGAWAMQMTLSTTAAYSLSKLKPLFSGFFLMIILSTLMVPPMAYLIPQYLTVVRLPILGFSLLDSWWGVLLPQAANAFNIFILKSFFDEIPRDLTDAAEIDGARPLQVFATIMLPLSKPVLAVVTIFTVIGTWKDFFWPYLILTGSPQKQPIMVALHRLTTALSYPQPLNIQMAGMAIAALPPLILFLVFQKQIIRGITLTGLKG